MPVFEASNEDCGLVGVHPNFWCYPNLIHSILRSTVIDRVLNKSDNPTTVDSPHGFEPGPCSAHHKASA